MFDLTPDPIAFRIGPLDVHWYGITYAVGLIAVYWLITRLARRAGRDADLVNNGILIVAAAALVGGRLYHVIDQWDLYRNDLLAIVRPPYSGLGVYGGIITGTLAAWLFVRWKREPFWVWADIVAPGLFLMQAIGRWGNFFNQELFGPPTTLPWGIPIDCSHQLTTICNEAARFHPLFLYESLSGIAGMLFLLFLGSRFRDRLRPGDLLLIFFIWYGTTRFLLEFLRTNNWTVGGIPTAQIVSLAFIAVGIAGLAWRHRPGRPADDEWDEDEEDDANGREPDEEPGAKSAERSASREAPASISSIDG